MPIAYIAFGSNLGDRTQNIKDALTLLQQEGVSLIKTSSILESDPMGGPSGQGKYLNGVVKVETRLDPHDLLKLLLSIELRLGRVRTVKNAARTIDLDILLFDQVKFSDEHLQIPHPRMKKRDFVMKPLLEIEPDIFK